MLISKEQFKDIFYFIKKMNDKQMRFMDALEDLCPGEYVNTFIYSEYEEKLLELLQNMFDDVHDDINYFLFEMDTINKDDFKVEPYKAPKENGEPLYYDLDTLYDYLVAHIGEKHE